MKIFKNALSIENMSQPMALGVDKGKIKFWSEDFCPSENAEIIDLEGLIITSGFIDCHTHLGISEYAMGWEGQDFNEISDPLTPHLRAIDGINPQDKAFKNALASGVTTVMIAPGSLNILGGEIAVLKTWGSTVDEMLISDTAGIKAALGENPKKTYGQRGAAQAPVTRMASAAILRQALLEGQKYQDQEQTFDLKKEGLRKIINGERKLRVHAHRADDIMTALRIAKEFNLEIVLDHCTEGHLIAEEIKKSGFSAAVGPAMAVASKIELQNLTAKTPGILNKKGVSIALISDHPVTPVEQLRLACANAVCEGLEKTEALKAITINAAKILDLDQRIGSLEQGKDADFVIWDQDPFLIQAKALAVFVDGQQVAGEKRF